MLYHDSWMYFGYFRDLSGHMTGFADYYYSTRLSVILPGWAAHSLLPPVAANHALHLAVYYAAVFAAYAGLCELAGRRAALLAAVGLGGHPFFLMAVGWDYADGFGIAYWLLAACLLTRAGVGPNWRRNCFLAGACAAALVVANVTYGLLIPPLALIAWAANRSGRRHGLLPGAVAFAAGGLAAFGLLSAVYARYTGDWWLPGPSLRCARLYGGVPNPFRAEGWGWLARAGWLWLPALTSLVAAVALFRSVARGSWRDPRSLPAAAVLAQALAVAGVFAYSQSRP